MARKAAKAGPAPAHSASAAAAGVTKRRRKRRLSGAASLMEVVQLGGASADDLMQALLQAGPGDGDAAVLIAALKAAERRRAGAGGAGAEPEALRRVAELQAVITLGGGTTVALMDALAELGAGAGDLEIVAAALAQSAVGEAGAGGAVAADAEAVPSSAPEEGDEVAAADTVVEGKEGGRKRKKREGRITSMGRKKAGKPCRLCRALPSVPAHKNKCDACCALVARVKATSAGVCTRDHVRAAFAELGSGAKLKAVKRRARQLAGVLPLESSDPPPRTADPVPTPAPAAGPRSAPAAPAEAERPRPQHHLRPRQPQHAQYTRFGRHSAPATPPAAGPGKRGWGPRMCADAASQRHPSHQRWASGEVAAAPRHRQPQHLKYDDDDRGQYALPRQPAHSAPWRHEATRPEDMHGAFLQPRRGLPQWDERRSHGAAFQHRGRSRPQGRSTQRRHSTQRRRSTQGRHSAQGRHSWAHERGGY